MSGQTAGSSPSTQCDCWALTLRIANLCSRGRGLNQSQGLRQPQACTFSSSSPSSMPGTESQLPPNNLSALSISTILNTGRKLAIHWEMLNGCADSVTHMGPQTLHYMIESISWVLHDYEEASEVMSRSASETQTLPRQPASTTVHSSISQSTLWNTEHAAEWSMPTALVGNLKLEPAEAILVAQEAFSHSIARLTLMLQDIEEEAALQRQQPNADYSLQEKDLRDLVTRMFRLLRRMTGVDLRMV